MCIQYHKLYIGIVSGTHPHILYRWTVASAPDDCDDSVACCCSVLELVEDGTVWVGVAGADDTVVVVDLVAGVDTVVVVDLVAGVDTVVVGDLVAGVDTVVVGDLVAGVDTVVVGDLVAGVETLPSPGPPDWLWLCSV